MCGPENELAGVEHERLIGAHVHQAGEFRLVDAGIDHRVPVIVEEPEEAVEADVHVVGVSSLAAGHLTLVPALRAELDALGRDDMMIVVGGVIPAQDFDELRAAGADAIYPPGTVIPAAAVELLQKLRDRLDDE